MKGFAERKVPSGKLVKAAVEFSSAIVKVRFFGDFFLHPEDTLDAIEKNLVGLPAVFPLEDFEKKIESVLKKENAQLVGATANDFAVVLQEAIQNSGKE